VAVPAQRFGSTFNQQQAMITIILAMASVAMTTMAVYEAVTLYKEIKK